MKESVTILLADSMLHVALVFGVDGDFKTENPWEERCCWVRKTEIMLNII